MGATESGVLALTHETGIELEVGRPLPWLSNRGHLNPVLQDAVPPSVLELLRTIYERLGGDEGALAGKRAGSSPRPDFTLASAALIVDVDEIQHFTSDRLATRRVGSVCHFARPQRDAQALSQRHTDAAWSLARSRHASQPQSLSM
jgi:hypothetical protein